LRSVFHACFGIDPVGVIFAVIWNRAAFATFYTAVEKQEMERFDRLAPQPVEV